MLWTIVVGVVSVEIAIVSFLLLPLPSSFRTLLSRNLMPARHVFLGVAVLFLLMGFNAFQGANREHTESANASLHFEELKRQARHQRNFYICGGGIIFSLLCFFLVSLVGAIGSLQQKEHLLNKAAVQSARAKREDVITPAAEPTTDKKLEQTFPK